jgi:hypothetical protein
VIRSIYYVSRILGNLAFSWLTLGWTVRKARRAFEAELRKEGMSKEDARRISRCYSDLKSQFSLRSIMSYYREARRQGKP